MESAQRALLAQLRIDLEFYYREHGRFPADLGAVAISSYRDGFSPETLRQFTYASDGRSYTLTCIGAFTSALVTVSSEDLAANRRHGGGGSSRPRDLPGAGAVRNDAGLP